ncbi:hypothetical protein Godav_020071 [Gossypium davidsonii]|uniref:DEP domain-containing protein n=1 Tax=Gossypium davidsonii TaxID=34287 RepID=A0A7J8R1T6_GOSDV|nr:hypothetical protein [Gossypium davidsonii]
MEKDNSGGKNATVSLIDERLGEITDGIQKVQGKPEETRSLNVSNYNVIKLDEVNGQDRSGDDRDQNQALASRAVQDNLGDKEKHVKKCDKMDKDRESYSKALEEMYETAKAVHFDEPEPVFGGTEVPGMETKLNSSTCSSGFNLEEGYMWPEKAVVLKNFVKEKGAVAVTNVLHHLSIKRDDVEMGTVRVYQGAPGSSKIGEQTAERSAWNPLNYIKMSCTADAGWKAEQGEDDTEGSLIPVVTKGKVLLYTRLGCQDCREVRWFLRNRRLRYVEINIDLYPSRKLELEKLSGSCAVPKVFFNEVLIGGLSELKHLDMSGKLAEKIDFLITEAPSTEAPLSPLSGEDDVSCKGPVDELALIVQKMKRYIVVKDRFYKMRRFTNCFLGSEAVDFLSEDQYLEREEAVEFGRKLASELFFRHVLDENLLEDSNHLYRFLDHDPVVSTQCHNTPRGMIELKPKPITEIASRLRFLFCAILEAYASEDGRLVDYRSVHGSEEFARYLRIIQELQRVDVQDMPREEKLAFFINLYNMMAIHAILVWGHPNGSLEWRKLLGDFKYVVGGFTYSLSSIHNGILRCNQRPPFNLLKPFGVRDKRLQVALPYPEPLIHFALVCGTRSGPALQCYSSRNIDKELMDAARVFIRSGGLTVDLSSKVAYASKVLKWFSVDFGQNEIEVLKHASNYLEPTNAEAFLGIIADSQLRIIYQPYDWGLNCYT